jgi:hypothetical protein
MGPRRACGGGNDFLHSMRNSARLAKFGAAGPVARAWGLGRNNLKKRVELDLVGIVFCKLEDSILCQRACAADERAGNA